METRNISVTLEQAIKWYNSGNATLRELALNAYTKDELELSYNLIESQVYISYLYYDIPRGEERKFEVLTKLATIAKFYNKDWKKTTDNTGYFIGSYNNGNSPAIDIYTNNIAQYPGVVYFKNYKDAIQAVKILGDEVKELFNEKTNLNLEYTIKYHKV